MVTVSGVALGLSSQSVVESEGVDYWVVPEQASVESLAVSTGGLQLGDVHSTSAALADDQRIDYATPVLLELVPVRDVTTGERTYILTVGVIPKPGTSILGFPTDDLIAGDPHYANGTYDGPWTGEAVVNDAAATLTNASTGDKLVLAGGSTNQSFSVVNVTTGGAETAGGTVPMMVVHLSELQAVTGATNGDAADQLLVSTNDPSVRSLIEQRYPKTTVVTRQGLSAQQVSTSNLPLAIASAALISTIVIGVLFLTTLIGLDVSGDREQLGTLAAIGFTARSRSLLVGTETVLIALLGGVVGIGLGFLGIVGVNAIGAVTYDVAVVAVFDPLLGLYAIGVAAIIGLLGAIYPVILSWRTDALEVLSG
ncbi:ABC transporter permease [Haloarcula nitratireducens]|uniref:ABC transporter permease n=1 Tax=Haloarcula nitratireducens TaxID=2487749 RepID=A0AAW4PJF8_9EURY|nr:ABC transporter permease [Halomicroarcula nitratireducens]MBX0297440.1 ABC transporter permease [Halomicroarcula nitratireducens]